MSKYFLAGIIFSLAFLISSCGGGTHTDTTTIVIDPIHDIKDIQQASIIKNVQIVRLETSEEALIGEINKVVVQDGRIYIGDFYINQNVCIFDMQGKLVNVIRRQGHGPGEYVQLRDFFIDARSGTVNLLTGRPSKILSFDSEGKELVSVIDLSKELFAICPIENGYAGYTAGFAQNEPCNLWIMDENYQVVRGEIPIDKGWKSTHDKNLSVFSQYGARTYYLSPREHIIYDCTEKAVAPVWKVDFGQYNWPKQVDSYDKFRDLNPEEMDQFVTGVSYFQETNRYWLFNFTFKGQVRLAAYDKQAGTSKVYELTGDDRSYFIPFGHIRAITEHAIVSEISAMHMKPFVDGHDGYNDFEKEYPEQIARLRKIIPSIEVDDNPCLIIYSI